MQHALSLRAGLVACLAALLLAGGIVGCSAKITQDPGQMLADKVKTNQNAYLRYSQAEEEARRDGNAEAADHYRQAKEAALADFQRYDQELAQYKTAHHTSLSQ
ncbi:hypothetical protein [Solidesulfovibrio sp.]|uniref:hypothetical protein n=1 Tax=Solidesulfovibrio sp. TaxID=2910990 RepID=UPI002617FB54|nr:hypothetical protein [Solidesulfovibrio sp.]